MGVFDQLGGIQSAFGGRVSPDVERMASGGDMDELMRQLQRQAIFQSVSNLGGALVTGSQYGSATEYGPQLAAAGEPLGKLPLIGEKIRGTRAEETRAEAQLKLATNRDNREQQDLMIRLQEEEDRRGLYPGSLTEQMLSLQGQMADLLQAQQDLQRGGVGLEQDVQTLEAGLPGARAASLQAGAGLAGSRQATEEAGLPFVAPEAQSGLDYEKAATQELIKTPPDEQLDLLQLPIQREIAAGTDVEQNRERLAAMRGSLPTGSGSRGRAVSASFDKNKPLTPEKSRTLREDVHNRIDSQHKGYAYERTNPIFQVGFQEQEGSTEYSIIDLPETGIPRDQVEGEYLLELGRELEAWGHNPTLLTPQDQEVLRFYRQLQGGDDNLEATTTTGKRMADRMYDGWRRRNALQGFQALEMQGAEPLELP